MTKEKKDRLTKRDRLALMLLLLDIIEVYNLETMTPTVKYSLKKAVKNAIKYSKELTTEVSKYVTPIDEPFAIVADQMQEVIESFYLNRD